MKALFILPLIALIHGSYAALLIKGPTEPVLEGQPVTLECQYSDSAFNISQVRFEVFSKYVQRWHQFYERYWCYNAIEMVHLENSVVLTIPHAGRYYEGPYRCASYGENVTAPDNVSEPLAFKVNYMAEVSLSREGYTSYLGLPQDLKVRQGDDVVLKCSASSSEEPNYFWYKEDSDWILPSATLTLKKVTAMDQGQYTCKAEHSVKSLSKERSISITVLAVNAPWCHTTNGRLILGTSAVMVCLVVFVAAMSAFLCRRAKQNTTSKGPIDDRSQKKPIYKASVESLPSTSGDKQPLV